MGDPDEVGAQFARAFTAKDSARVADLLHPEVDFKGLTPSRAWEAQGKDDVVSLILGAWLEESDVVESLDSVDTGQVADRQRVGYRFTVTNPDGRFVVEQQAYLTERDGKIDWMRVVCTGFRPAPAVGPPAPE
jgi:hypothetical protein